MTSSNRDEAQTRTEIIDSQLAYAGWSRNRRTLVEEFLLQIAESESTYGNEQFADYVLLGSDGKPIAVVEAKRSSRDELAGKRQAADYADAIKAKFGSDPFIFLTNGKEIQFWIENAMLPARYQASTREMIWNVCVANDNSPSRSMAWRSTLTLPTATIKTKLSAALQKA